MDLRAGYELEFEDTFDGDELDLGKWFPYYLPHWSSRERAAARYRVEGGCLHLLIEQDQEPWCPEFDGDVKVSSLQTGHRDGQHRFNPAAVVRDEQPELRLYTPQYGLIELRARALDDPRNMVALWMIGFEDEPERSGEICVCEIFGRDVGRDSAGVGMGVHPFADPAIEDDFAVERLEIDARDFHTYSAEWTPDDVSFYVDDEHVRTVEQSPAYPMQLMLNVYEFPGDADETRATPHPKDFAVDWVRGYRR